MIVSESVFIELGGDILGTGKPEDGKSLTDIPSLQPALSRNCLSSQVKGPIIVTMIVKIGRRGTYLQQETFSRANPRPYVI